MPVVLRVAAPQLVLEVLLHPDRRAAARQVGADEQRGRAALGHRDEAALLARGVDRPRREHDRRGDRHHPPAQQRAPSASAAGRARSPPPMPAIRNGTGSRSVRVRIVSPNSAPAAAKPSRPGSSLDRQRERDERRQQQERAQAARRAGRRWRRSAAGRSRRSARPAARPTARRGSRRSAIASAVVPVVITACCQ